ncbi:hypothetical protein O7599_07345 [Streptomyces sp. WMMC500]|uniref:hypothetical protein n=1 Tax=Streptomyces sp. WMMC500 TaxID=3015154 RepID=UPI00248D1BD0|nr:hypothetical protein [Streptomyces sp. WMMC500]WBB62337.1 hypothetical protein O7599_07345 [Streptomyces sp. WMMC500]
MKATHDPFGAVHAVVDGLEGGIAAIPRAAARIAALKIGVYGAAEPTPHDSRDEAVAEVSRMIAEDLAAHHETLKTHLNGREYSVHTLSLYGEGCGVLLQQVTTEGDWLRQFCFLIDTDHSIHPYRSYDR